jgi:hypothetical protein
MEIKIIINDSADNEKTKNEKSKREYDYTQPPNWPRKNPNLEKYHSFQQQING